MIDNDIALWSVVVALSVACSALFSGLESGAYGVNVVRLNVLAHRGGGSASERRARRLLRELERPDRLLATLLIGNNLVNYLGALGVSAILTAMHLSDWGIVVINAAVLTPLLFVFGETLPKDFFRASADKLMPRFAGVLVALRWAFTITLALPIVGLIGLIIARVVRDSDASAMQSARARVVALLKEGRRHGVLSDAQSALVDRAVRLHERRVASEMTPWSRVVFMSSDWTRGRVNNVAKKQLHGHYPVVDRRGRVIGVVRTIDLWLDRAAPVTTLMKPPVLVDAETTIVETLQTLRRAGARHAVVERRGKPVGFIAERDLVEPLLGEVRTT